MPKFSDIPQFLLTEYINILSDLHDEITSSNDQAHLSGNAIITRGGNLIEFYIDADIDYCRQNDQYGLCNLADEGKIEHMAGIDEDYDLPSDSIQIKINEKSNSIRVVLENLGLV
jgi:adenylylsulfate kinase-like enzyme